MAVVALAGQSFSSGQQANSSSLSSLNPAYRKEPPIFILNSPQPSFKDNSSLGAPAAPDSLYGTSSFAGNLMTGLVGGILGQPSTTGAAASQSAGNAPASAAAAPNSALLGPSHYSASGFYRAHAGAPPPIEARAAAVADLLSGEGFYSLNPGVQWPLASFTKLFSGAVAWDLITPSQIITLDGADFLMANPGNPLRPGERYSANDLLKAMFVISSNEAAEAFADFYGRDHFLSLMVDYARRWGLQNTNFKDPTGLSASDQSTIYDLAKAAPHIYQDYPGILKITRTPSAYIRELNSGRRILLKNINDFAIRSDFWGGKTGYTDEAQGNLLSIFNYGKRPVLVIVLGTADRFGDTQKLLEWFESNYAQ